MSNTIYLYLKTHNKTGMKYLGKTIKDPYLYKGSGTQWKNHLKKHGEDVTTEVLLETSDAGELKKVGIEYSEKWKIVESEEFANMIPEYGAEVDEADTKNDQLLIKIEKDKKKEFIKLCKKDDTTASRELRNFITKFIEEHKK